MGIKKFAVFVGILLIAFGVGIAVSQKYVVPDSISVATNKSSQVSLVQDKLVELSEWATLRYD